MSSSRPLLCGIREVGEADTAAGPPAPSEANVRAAYRAGTAEAIRARLGLAGTIFLACIGATSAAEQWIHPERSPTVWIIFAVYAASWNAALAAARMRRFAPHTQWVAAGLAVLVSLTMAGYARLIHGELEILAIGQLCLLCGLSAVVPWGWRPQLLVALAAALGLAGVTPTVGSTVHPAFCAIALASGVVTSVAGAAFLERVQFAEFLRSALLAHASAAHREEADVSSALFRVAQALHAQLDPKDVVPSVTRLAVEVLGCDDCYLYLRNHQRGTFRLHAHSGLRAGLQARASDADLTADVSLIAALSPGTLCEIADVEQQGLVRHEVPPLADCGALLALAVCHGSDPIGVLVFSWRRRTETFTRREHRLAFGVAHATAVALENARLVDEITASSHMKSQFLSTMSHEIRTPLNVICGYADILADGGFGQLAPEQRHAVTGIQRSTRHLIEFVDAGADLQRLEGGDDALTPTAVDLDDLFAEVRRDLDAADTTVIPLRWKNPLGRHPVTTDRAKLKTILKHLVGNALKFTAEGEVSVTVTEAQGALVVAVRDTGIGIAPADQSTIFEMFRQLDSSDTRRFGGTGIGLHIVGRLVQRLGGTVAVESAPGRGSTFTVSLPVAPAAPA
jgi:signal transduction histidine kinase